VRQSGPPEKFGGGAHISDGYVACAKRQRRYSRALRCSRAFSGSRQRKRGEGAGALVVRRTGGRGVGATYCALLPSFSFSRRLHWRVVRVRAHGACILIVSANFCLLICVCWQKHSLMSTFHAHRTPAEMAHRARGIVAAGCANVAQRKGTRMRAHRRVQQA
jgi:hypothetical protein